MRYAREYMNTSRQQGKSWAEKRNAFIEAIEKPLKPEMPKFRKYSERWPLGPPGHFYNSAGSMREITAMPKHYLISTFTWIDKAFKGNFDFAKQKQDEIAKVLMDEYRMKIARSE